MYITFFDNVWISYFIQSRISILIDLTERNATSSPRHNIMPINWRTLVNRYGSLGSCKPHIKFINFNVDILLVLSIVYLTHWHLFYHHHHHHQFTVLKCNNKYRVTVPNRICGPRLKQGSGVSNIIKNYVKFSKSQMYRISNANEDTRRTLNTEPGRKRGRGRPTPRWIGRMVENFKTLGCGYSLKEDTSA